MTNSETKTLLKFALGLFPEINETQAKLLADIMGPHHHNTVEMVLKNHRVSHDYFNFQQFAEGLRTASNRANERRRELQNERIIDWLWRQPGYAGMDAGAALIQHFAESWDKTKHSGATEFGIQSVRKLIRSHCITALRQIKWDEADCLSIADQCVGLEPGEKIVVPKHPKVGNLLTKEPTATVPPKSFDELKKLAVHEHTVQQEAVTA